MPTPGQRSPVLDLRGDDSETQSESSGNVQSSPVLDLRGDGSESESENESKSDSESESKKGVYEGRRGGSLRVARGRVSAPGERSARRLSKAGEEEGKESEGEGVVTRSRLRKGGGALKGFDESEKEEDGGKSDDEEDAVRVIDFGSCDEEPDVGPRARRETARRLLQRGIGDFIGGDIGAAKKGEVFDSSDDEPLALLASRGEQSKRNIGPGRASTVGKRRRLQRTAEPGDEESKDEESEDSGRRRIQFSSADDEPATQPLSRAKRVKRGRRSRVKRRQRMESESDGSGSFLVDDDDIAAEIEQELEESEEECESEREATLHPPEHLFQTPSYKHVRDTSATNFIKSDKHALKIYCEAIIRSALDSGFRKKLISNTITTFDLEVFRAAITRVEQDLLKAKAEHLEDGRWRVILKEMQERPYMTRFRDRLCITPQPVDLQNRLATYCNGCNYRAGGAHYHDPCDTLVFHGPRILEASRRAMWPLSIVEEDDGSYSFPNDVVASPLDADELEEKLRVARVSQYRAHGLELPAEEKRMACRLGVADDEYGTGVSSQLSPSLRRSSQSSFESAESGAYSDEDSCAEEESGFGLAEGCADRCVRYHRTIWARLELTRMIREGILVVLEDRDWDLSDEDCAPKMVQKLLRRGTDDGSLCIMKKLGSYFRGLLDEAERCRELREVQAKRGEEDCGNEKADRILVLSSDDGGESSA